MGGKGKRKSRGWAFPNKLSTFGLPAEPLF